MKKVLLGTSAVALIGAAMTPASAAEFEVRVGGYMEQHLAFSDVDNNTGQDFDGVDNFDDTEIFFLPSITLDNGLKIGANIQLEGSSGATTDDIDESYMFIRGSFGEINLGSENSAGYKMGYVAPDVSFFGINSGSGTTVIPHQNQNYFRGTLGATSLENAGNNDLMRVTYYTPRFAGFQVGVSYGRDNTEGGGKLDCDVVTCDFFDVGANYVNSFGGFDVAVSGRYGIASGATGAEDPEVFGFGANFGFAGVTIGGSWAEQNGTAAGDGTAYDVGISYETGPWGFSFTYFHGENHDLDNAFVPGNNDEELDQFLFAVNYKLAKGVSLGGYGGYIDFDEENSSANDVDGFFIGTGVKLSF